VSDGQLYLYIAVWSQIASSIVFIGALVFVWFRWILPLVMAAQARSNRQIAEAERHRDEMKGALEAVHAEVETARHDVRLIEERASARADHERQLLIDEARAEGERTLADASRELQRALAAARQRLRDEMLERALQFARKDAMERVTPDLDARFVERFAGSLEAAPRG
jgi:F0F1-type ATP synthase membrane subunit b/b'